MANETLILLGSNLGDRMAYLSTAIDLIDKMAGTVMDKSRIYVTAAWGIEDAADFYNQAIRVTTEFSPREMLEKLLTIEEILGRVRTGKLSSRTIDLDIGFWNDDVIDERNLTIPHPRLHLRNFALAPLADLVPGKVHPVLHKTVRELYDSCPDRSEVTILPA